MHLLMFSYHVFELLDTDHYFLFNFLICITDILHSFIVCVSVFPRYISSMVLSHENKFISTIPNHDSFSKRRSMEYSSTQDIQLIRHPNLIIGNAPCREIALNSKDSNGSSHCELQDVLFYALKIISWITRQYQVQQLYY